MEYLLTEKEQDGIKFKLELNKAILESQLQSALSISDDSVYVSESVDPIAIAATIKAFVEKIIMKVQEFLFGIKMKFETRQIPDIFLVEGKRVMGVHYRNFTIDLNIFKENLKYIDKGHYNKIQNLERYYDRTKFKELTVEEGINFSPIGPFIKDMLKMNNDIKIGLTKVIIDGESLLRKHSNDSEKVKHLKTELNLAKTLVRNHQIIINDTLYSVSNNSINF